MPIYELRCEDCAHDFEVFVRRESTPTDCPSCGSTRSQRRVSRTSFLLKGTGWYASEYGVKMPGAASEGSEPAAAAPAVEGCAREAAGGACACKAAG